ncbi:MAG: ABC transporter substrate-binding protein [Oleiphilus sp.]|nr:MAG: ABC transporter substrate-binding protein [Oleiphilus sp.]
MLLRILTLLLFCIPVFAKEPLIIALDADLSAVAKTGGVAIKRGALIAIDEINANGGLLGRPLELQEFDHRGNPARGIANIKRIAQLDNVLAVLGGVHTPVALQELPHIHEYGLLYLDPWAAGTPIVDNGYRPNFVFRVSVRDQEAGKVLVDGAKKKGAKRIALLLERTGWGRSNEKSMTAAAEAAGLEVATVQWFNWKQRDMEAEVRSIAESRSEAILLVGNAPEGAVAMRAILDHKDTMELPVFSHWGLAGGTFVKKLGIQALKQSRLFVLQSYSFLKPHAPDLNSNVLRAYQRLFDPKITATNIPAAVGVAHSYDLIHLLRLAVEQAGSANPAKVRAALENLPPHKGLVKNYAPAFSPQRHDALWAEDYFLSHYDSNGYLIPVGLKTE